MNLIKSLMAMACAAAFLAGTSQSALAQQSCCVKAKAAGKKACAHECCIAAHKEKKTCEKCQAKPTCCDKAIAQGKECAHKCCVAAFKDKKICEDCNPKEKKPS